MTYTSESGRTYDGFDVAAMCLQAMALRNLADDLKRRGGGFTATAERMARAKAARLERDASYIAAELEAAAP